MKKTYQKPELSVFSTGFQLMDNMTVVSGCTNTNSLNINEAKDRDDEEYYEPEGGDYGNLW